MTVEIEKARELGFCFGVRRAIKMVHAAVSECKQLDTLGPIVHNRIVVKRLADMGVTVVDDLDHVRSKIVAITSHGCTPEMLSQIRARGLTVVDTTCPNVRNAQKACRKLTEAGFGVIIFGEATHPEVKALLGWAGEKAIATLNGDKLTGTHLSHRMGILSQTTQSRQQFSEFIKSAVNSSLPYTRELRIINTLCEETQKRQHAALELAGKSDLVLVVGGRNSANTQRIAEICSSQVQTYLIETAAEIEDVWLEKKRRIGVTAGASTPDESIDEVVSELNKRVERGKQV
jgi:4-hydroxy-3-methylbut-2-enyl diphosphate reductase